MHSHLQRNIRVVMHGFDADQRLNEVTRVVLLGERILYSSSETRGLWVRQLFVTTRTRCACTMFNLLFQGSAG